MSSQSSSMGDDASPASTAPSSVLDEKVPCPIVADYSTFRPSYHLQPRTGWLNDPCAPGYDYRTKLYHLSFQHNPNGPDWGDICWSSMTSPDLIRWTLLPGPTLQPDRCYDAKGVFTGCLIPPNCLDEDEPLTVAYTSVNALPIHHTLLHAKGSESLSLAYSSDGGRTWNKSDSNPILPSEPEGVEVTGWRDPYVAPWTNMSGILGMDASSTLYGIISGGIRDRTPTTFLYSINNRVLDRWNYVGPLTSPGLNTRLSRWSGDFGKNWEVANFMTLTSDHGASVSRDFLIMGTEGCVSTANPELSDPAADGPSRPLRGQLWMAGTLRKKTSDCDGGSAGEVDLSCDYSGFLDHGCLYAANSFFDPVYQKQVVWGWITEEDLCDELRHVQGWSGLLSLPRELFLQTLERVTGTIGCTPLRDITSIETTANQDSSSTVRTLATRPVQEVVEYLRQGQAVRRINLGPHNLGNKQTTSIAGHHISTQAWELECSFHLSPRCRRIGVRFIHSACSSQRTTLAFDPVRETFTVDRPSFPSPESKFWINSSQESAPHTLFMLRDPESGVSTAEALHIHLWRDNSVLEIFVNGRTAISTRVYAAGVTLGIDFFADEAPLSTTGETDVAQGSKLISAVLRDGIGLH